MTLANLINPPKFRNKENSFEDERKTTWTELLYDLVFVVALRVMSSNLETNLNITEVLKFALLFIALWWAWAGYTFYTDRFDSNDLIQKIMTLFQMFAISGLAIFSHTDFDKYFAGFAICYIFVRIILIASYIRIYLNILEARDLAVRYAFGFSLALIPWLIAIFLRGDLRILMIIVALIVDFGAPITQTRLQSKLPLNISHLPERFGLFVLLVLGEIIFGVVTSTEKVIIDFKIIYTIFAAIFVTFTFWWTYFETLSGKVLRGMKLASQIWTYIHILLTISMALVGVSFSTLILDSLEHSSASNGLNLLFISFALCILCLNIIEYLRTSKEEKIRQERIDLIIRTIIPVISLILVLGNFTNIYFGIGTIIVLSLTILITDIVIKE